MKRFLICLVLIAAAFGIGYGWGYLKLQEAQKKWTAANQELQTRVGSLERDLALAQARVVLWEVPLTLSQISAHLADKNFGLATQSLDQLKAKFLPAQTLLGNEWQGKFDFFLPGLEEIRTEAQSLSPDTRIKNEDLRARFEQSLRSLPSSGK